jgi:hypothetical protein
MSEPDHIIGTALRDLADEATPTRLNADALWRAGRRRRWAAITTSVAGAAAALIPLALLGALANPAPAPEPGPAASGSVLPPIQFRQVARIADSRCLPRSHGLPGISKAECFYFTRVGVTISRFASVKIAEQTVTCGGTRRVLHATLGPSHFGSLPPAEGPGTIVFSFRLQRADIHPYANLTQKLVNQPSPRNQLAIVANGVVIFHPQTVNDVSSLPAPSIMMTASTLHSPQHSGGWIFQLGWLTRPQAQEFLGHLPGPACFP